jgi:hypothetical protein
MSQTTDRSIRDNRLLIAVILGIVLMVAGGIYFEMSRNASDAARKPGEPDVYPLIQPAFRNEPLSATIYYPREGMLVAGTAAAKRQPDTQAQAREIIASALQDRAAAQTPVLRDIKLRAFYLEGLASAQAAERLGCSPGAFRVLCYAFRCGDQPEFLTATRPGPRDQPKKSAAQEQIIALRHMLLPDVGEIATLAAGWYTYARVHIYNLSAKNPADPKEIRRCEQRLHEQENRNHRTD